MPTHGSLFSGIGGFDLGFRRAGIETAWQVEIDEYCRKVLAKNFPETERFTDIKECGAHNLTAVDIISGGFPCQPWSVAGKQGGTADDRNLWPEMFRVIGELRPRWVVAENVPNLDAMGYLDVAIDDLESIGYEVRPVEIPAAGVGAPHLRRRIWIVAYARSIGNPAGITDQTTGEEGNSTESINGSEDVSDAFCLNDDDGRHGTSPICREQRRSAELSGGEETMADTGGERLPITEQEALQGSRRGQEGGSVAECGWWSVEPDVGRVAHGVPSRVDRLKGLGNAIVPQIAEIIARIILNIDSVSPHPAEALVRANT